MVTRIKNFCFVVFCGLFVFFALLCKTLHAQFIAYPQNQTMSDQQLLVIYGTTDSSLFSKFSESFQRNNPDVSIYYKELESGIIFNSILRHDLQPEADLIISSAADLQMKLANDAYALSYRSPNLHRLPDWAHWRNEVYGFTFEPAVIVYNRKFLSDGEAPRTHLQLIKLLEKNKSRFMKKVGTYNIATSGVGYVLATHDVLISSKFWQMTNVFADIDVYLSRSSSELLDALEEERLTLAYNVLGSYAFARASSNKDLGIIVPNDYALVLSRSVLIPRTAKNPQTAKRFIDFLLSNQGQEIASGEIGFESVTQDFKSQFNKQTILKMSSGTVQPIAFMPSLLIAYDHQKRTQFLKVWHEVIGATNLQNDKILDDRHGE
ncbi:ABC transporter substrate-binding protein [Bartonella tamiae]|uniref:Uncharacterized protein n=1 Tax=Bartonella tamiae Th239 TaxID=1094558 RepID=J1JXF8_9HYPH|nr:ABC transporter substrate-binding protein [Bartonella tamiae]EJF89305.1 hypothetical protein ME5_01856 [Bartonella tamiae Th239]EJF95533.1 hypothetical protein MEG_00023 [Bartonella tamiae Th307]